jgi:hypothetical protein
MIKNYRHSCVLAWLKVSIIKRHATGASPTKNQSRFTIMYIVNLCRTGSSFVLLKLTLREDLVSF